MREPWEGEEERGWDPWLRCEASPVHYWLGHLLPTTRAQQWLFIAPWTSWSSFFRTHFIPTATFWGRHYPHFVEECKWDSRKFFAESLLPSKFRSWGPGPGLWIHCSMFPLSHCITIKNILQSLLSHLVFSMTLWHNDPVITPIIQMRRFRLNDTSILQVPILSTGQALCCVPYTITPLTLTTVPWPSILEMGKLRLGEARQCIPSSLARKCCSLIRTQVGRLQILCSLAICQVMSAQDSTRASNPGLPVFLPQRV